MMKWVTCLIGVAMAASAWGAPASLHIIPKPQHVVVEQGHFALDRHATIAAPAHDARAQAIAAFLRHAIKRQNGITIEPAKSAGTATIRLRLDPSIKGKEAYRLDVTPTRIVIAAATNHGLFWGVETLRQMLPLGKHRQLVIPSVHISDAPRYPWRGVMLDVSRHFKPVSFIKKQIRLMAYYKFNVLHWHLTDDQGWRIQIKKYPKLTSLGAWRTEADGSRYGGYYTQKQIREVVAYAKARGIRVVPEIEMPGHSSAAIFAYPSLSCGKKPSRVPTNWGVFDYVDCVDDATFAFLDNVLDEVIALFPSTYIHIGGDEVPQGVWAHCKPCKKLERRKGLHGEQQLHSYFIERMRKYLESHGKTLVGWDEIMEGGLNPSAVVEIWRGADEAAKALANGNRIIIAGPFYLDASIGSRTLQDLYRNDPFNNPLFAKYPGKVLGGEAPLWAERVLSVANAEAKLYPRLLAVSEHLWNPAAHDWGDFQRRVKAQYPWLTAQHVAYGPANQNIVNYSTSYHPGYHRWRLRAERGFDDMRMHYTTDGSQPTAASPAFGNVLDLYAPTTVKVAPFRGGVRYQVARTFRMVDNLALSKPVSYATPPSPGYAGDSGRLVNGLLGTDDYHDGNWVGWQGANMDATIDLGKLTPLHALKTEFLQSAASWILLPQSVTFKVSDDGKVWQVVKAATLKSDPAAHLHEVSAKLPAGISARYVRVTATPRAMSVPGRQSFIFADEIIVE